MNPPRDLLPEEAALPEVEALPRSIAPERDLWPDIQAQIAPRRAALPWARLAVAAALLMGLSASLTAWWLQPAPPIAPAPQEATAAAQAWESEMRAAADELATALDARRGELDPATVAVVEANLAVIDQAIGECAAALAKTPDDPQLTSALRRAWAQKLALLERAATLPKLG